MKILLNNTSESKLLPGFNHKLTWTGGIKSEDQSGDSNSTAESFDGFKAVLITITLLIRFGDIDAFKALTEIFHATKDSSPVVYDIIHPELNTFGVNQVKFIDDIRSAPDGQQKVYNITLTMKQERSDPEIVEERKTLSTAATSQLAGTGSVTSESDDLVDLSSTTGQAGMFEEILSKLNDVSKDMFFK